MLTPGDAMLAGRDFLFFWAVADSLDGPAGVGGLKKVDVVYLLFLVEFSASVSPHKETAPEMSPGTVGPFFLWRRDCLRSSATSGGVDGSVSGEVSIFITLFKAFISNIPR